MTTIVVAENVERAKSIIRTGKIEQAIPVSPRSVKGGAGRGIMADRIIVDGRIWPLERYLYEALAPCMFASPNPTPFLIYADPRGVSDE